MSDFRDECGSDRLSVYILFTRRKHKPRYSLQPDPKAHENTTTDERLISCGKGLHEGPANHDYPTKNDGDTTTEAASKIR
jgi:hypothetical protein